LVCSPNVGLIDPAIAFSMSRDISTGSKLHLEKIFEKKLVRQNNCVMGNPISPLGGDCNSAEKTDQFLKKCIWFMFDILTGK
jgi:hypothetical protein